MVTSAYRGVKFKGFTATQRFSPDSADRSYYDETTVGLRFVVSGKGAKGMLGFAAEVYFVQLPPDREKQKPPKDAYPDNPKAYRQFYDYERGQKVTLLRVNDTRSATLRRPVSLPIYDKRRLEAVTKTEALYDPSRGTNSRGSNPSTKYND